MLYPGVHQLEVEYESEPNDRRPFPRVFRVLGSFDVDNGPTSVDIDQVLEFNEEGEEVDLNVELWWEELSDYDKKVLQSMLDDKAIELYYTDDDYY